MNYIIAACALSGLIIGLLNLGIYEYTKDIGAIFISLLKMVVVPIAFVSIAGAIIKFNGEIKKPLFTMILMSAAGIVIGFAVMLAFPVSPIEKAKDFSGEAPTVIGFIKGCIPENPVKSFADGNMLQVIVCAVLVGFASRFLDESKKIEAFFDVAQKICLKIAKIVFLFAPIGVFCLTENIGRSGGLSVISGYVYMILAMIIGSIIYVAVVCAPTLYLSGTNVKQFFRTMLTGDFIGAVSGGATNYLAPRIGEMKKLPINQETIDLILPIVSVLMRAGSCICVGIYTVFAANTYGVTITAYDLAIVVAVGIIALTAAPGIIGGTLMDCAIIFTAIGLPIEILGAIAGIDYIMDVIRTFLNVQGGEVVVASSGWEREDV